ncbi:hypothetical protein [Methylomonas sp. UP202]|uniref:hypothetical protein n=1 Tax=Methylomonas sp. UP202 TaxID=3040943 RepID=UPI002479E74D|nr:hypothetical protein [Methylomonas sp. UP202]WGS85267.1 hypothetical protein QC632_19805 [Methylomonas sp. UP202]
MKVLVMKIFFRFLVFIIFPQLVNAEILTVSNIKEFSDLRNDYIVRNVFFAPDKQKLWITLDENERNSSKLIGKKIWRVNASGVIESDSIYSEIKNKYLNNETQDFSVESVIEDGHVSIYLIKKSSGYLIIRDGFPVIRLDLFKLFHMSVFQRLLVLNKGYLLIGSSEGKGAALKTGLDGTIEWERYYESNIDVHNGLFAKDGKIVLLGSGFSSQGKDSIWFGWLSSDGEIIKSKFVEGRNASFELNQTGDVVITYENFKSGSLNRVVSLFDSNFKEKWENVVFSIKANKVADMAGGVSFYNDRIVVVYGLPENGMRLDILDGRGRKLIEKDFVEKGMIFNLSTKIFLFKNENGLFVVQNNSKAVIEGGKFILHKIISLSDLRL